MRQGIQKGYRNLIVWQKSDELAFQIYVITRKFPKDELYVLTSQMRRCAISVPANIVEGYARSTNKEKVRFYNIAYGSLSELEYFIEFSLRLKYLTKEQFSELEDLRSEVGKLLNGFIKSTKQ